MTLHISRRRAVQAGLVAAAATALPPLRAAARQATPAAGDGAAIDASQVEAALAGLDGLIEDAMARTGVPGAAVAVVYDDAVVYERAFGVREIGKPDPVAPETVFQIGSVSKAISATTIAAVVGDGTTTWDATIASLDPGFALADPIAGSQVTVRDMFCHRSGLPAYAGDDLWTTFGYGRDETVRRLRFVPPAAPFRAAYAYENIGLSAAAYAVARAAGQPWEDLAEGRLLARLGMVDTSYRDADFLGREDRATPHYRTRDGVWTPGELSDLSATAAAGGVSSNVRDMSRWVRLQLAGGTFDGQQIVASEPLLETHRPHILAEEADPLTGLATFYGLAWEIEYDDRGRLLLRHGGDLSNGFRTGVYLLPAAGLGIVVLTNAWPNPLRDAIPRAFLDTVELGAPTQDWVGEIETITTAVLSQMFAAPFPQGAPPADATPALPLDVYVGAYGNDLFGTVTVQEENGGLTMALGANADASSLRHWDRDTFSYPLTGSAAAMYDQFGVVFTVGPDRQASALTLPALGGDTAATFARAATDS